VARGAAGRTPRAGGRRDARAHHWRGRVRGQRHPLHAPQPPISVEILAELRALSFGGAAAYSVLLIGIVLAITVAARLLGEERRTPAERQVTITG
jgi:hypothetical protein